MRYHFVDEIVSLALDGAPRIEVATRRAVAALRGVTGVGA